jgi:DNA-directed RNA polymerase specialized sigma24 family protein
LPDPQTASKERIHEELERAGVRTRLVNFGRSLTGSPIDAEDLVHQALVKVIDPDGVPWDCDGKKSLFEHVGSVMNGLWSNEWRSARVRYEVVDTDLVRDTKSVDRAPLADEALSEHYDRASLHRRSQVLWERLPEGDLARDVLRAVSAGHETPAAQAAAIGCSVDDVQKAYKRLTYLGRAILDEEGREEARRMQAVRSTAERKERTAT